MALILVTGSAGRIGQAVVHELTGRGECVRGFDLVPTPGATESHVGTLTDFATVRQAMAGVGALIHLAATPDDADFVTELMPNNLLGVYHILEAAREANVGRVVLASSGQVVWWQRLRGEVPIGGEVAVTPRGWYAATKCFLEAAGRSLAEAHGRTVLAVRLGWCPRPGQAQEMAESDWAKDVYLSPGDAGRFFALAALAPLDVRYAVVYAASRPLNHATYDLDATQQLLGYEPRDVWPQGVEEML